MSSKYLQATFCGQCLVFIFLLTIVHHSSATSSVNHPKGNSVSYDDRAFNSMENFDFKRLSSLTAAGSLSDSKQSLVLSSPSNQQNRLVSLFNQVDEDMMMATESPIRSTSNYRLQQLSQVTPSMMMALKPTSAEVVSSSAPLFPKSINEKIKSVQASAVSAVSSQDRFYQQVIPKLTAAIFNSRPSSLADDEDSVVQYRSPNAMMMAATPTFYQPMASGFRPIHPTSFVSPTQIPKRHRTPIDPSSIQFVTNLNQNKQPKPSIQTTPMLKSPPTIQTTTPPSRETYMTLSFEQPDESNKLQADQPVMAQIYPTVSTAMKQVHPMKTAAMLVSPSPSEIPKKRTGRAERRYPTTPAMPTTASIRPTSSSALSVPSPSSNPSVASGSSGDVTPSKVLSYYQQVFGADEQADLDNSPYLYSSPNNFNSLRIGSSASATSNYFQPQSQIQNNQEQQPTMTLSFQDPVSPTAAKAAAANGISLRQVMATSGADQSADAPFDWQQSVNRYAKEFGFEVPDYSGQVSHMDQSNDFYGTSNSARDSKYSSSSPMSTIQFNAYQQQQTNGKQRQTSSRYYPNSGSSQPGEINISGDLSLSNFDDEPMFRMADTNSMPNYMKPDSNTLINSEKSSDGPSKDEIQDLLKKYSHELQSWQQKKK